MATLLGIQNFLKMLLADVKQTAVVCGALTGEIFMEKKGELKKIILDYRQDGHWIK